MYEQFYQNLEKESARISLSHPSETENPCTRNLLGYILAIAPCSGKSDYFDAGSLAWCCMFGCPVGSSNCRRDEVMAHYGISDGLFEAIKQGMTEKYSMEGEVCYGSFAYCCIRFNPKKPCLMRNAALLKRFPDTSLEDALKMYFGFKGELAGMFEKVADCLEKGEPPDAILRQLFLERASPEDFLK